MVKSGDELRFCLTRGLCRDALASGVVSADDVGRVALEARVTRPFSGDTAALLFKLVDLAKDGEVTHPAAIDLVRLLARFAAGLASGSDTGTEACGVDSELPGQAQLPGMRQVQAVLPAENKSVSVVTMVPVERLLVDQRLRSLVPAPSPAVRKAMKTSIRERGVEVAVRARREDLTIFDGFTRHELAIEVGRDHVPVILEDIAAGEDLSDRVVRCAIERRQLTHWQLVGIAAKLLGPEKAKARTRMLAGKRVGDPSVTGRQGKRGKSVGAIAALLGVGERTLERGLRLLQDAPKELIALLEAGEISIGSAYREAFGNAGEATERPGNCVGRDRAGRAAGGSKPVGAAGSGARHQERGRATIERTEDCRPRRTATTVKPQQGQTGGDQAADDGDSATVLQRCIDGVIGYIGLLQRRGALPDCEDPGFELWSRVWESLGDAITLGRKMEQTPGAAQRS